MKELNAFRKFLNEGADDSYYNMTAAKKLAKKDGHDFDKLPKFARGKGVAHQQKYLDMAKAERANVSEEESPFPLIYVKDKKYGLEMLDRERLDYEIGDKNSQKGIGIRVFTPEDFEFAKNMLNFHGYEFDISENALANDKGDGTFEVTADIDIMGQKFNFSDICPGAHKAIANLAKEYANNDVMLGDLLYLANLHQTFFSS